MNTKNIPAIIMLTAGFISAIIMIKQGTGTNTYLITLLKVLIIFYILGMVIKFILDKFIKMDNPEDEAENENINEEESGDTDLENIPIVEAAETSNNKP